MVITKRQAKGYRLASLVAYFIKKLPPKRRERYYSEIKRIVEEYIFYSTEDVNNHFGGVHPRSVQNREPQLIRFNPNSAKNVGDFICNELEDGLAKSTSEGSREKFKGYLDEFMEEIRKGK